MMMLSPTSRVLSRTRARDSRGAGSRSRIHTPGSAPTRRAPCTRPHRRTAHTRRTGWGSPGRGGLDRRGCSVPLGRAASASLSPPRPYPPRPLWPSTSPRQRKPYLYSLLSDRVPENAYALYLQLDDVSLVQIAVLLDASATLGCPRAEDLARVDRLRLGGVGDHVRELVVHIRGVVLAPRLAVDADAHVEVVCVYLIGRDDARSQHVRAVPVLRLRRAHPHRQLAGLGIAGREVVPDRVAEDVAVCLLARDVLSDLPDYGGELEFVVELFSVRRVRNGLLRPYHGVRHPAVEGGDLVPLVGYRAPQPPKGVLEVPFEGEKVPQRARSQGSEQPGALYRGRRTDRSPGLDKGDHAAVEADVQDRVALENPYPGSLPGIVGNQRHVPPLLAAKFTASSILA